MDGSGSPARDISVLIDRPRDQVYAFASDPAHLPRWAGGLGSTVERIGGRWFADSPMGRVEVAFAPPNDEGILDHRVTLPDGVTVENRLRACADGDACRVVFTLVRGPGQSEQDFETDAATVAADLAALKAALESSPSPEGA